MHQWAIRQRLMLAFVALALVVGVSTAFAGLFGYERLGEYLVKWHAAPIMDMLIEAEERAWQAEDRDIRPLYYGSDLAEGLGMNFYVGKQVEAKWLQKGDGIHFLRRGDGFVFVRHVKGVPYALTGVTGERVELRGHMVRMLLLCLGAGLIVAALAAIYLSRRLSAPLEQLTAAVVSRQAAPTNEQPAPLPACQQITEVQILRNAIADYETALRSSALRESCFAGDVSHELRTPLTVLQGGLEILSAQMEQHEQWKKTRPVLARMERTIQGMTSLVRVLLLLARGAEQLDYEEINLALLLYELTEHRKDIEVSLEKGNRSFVHRTQYELASVIIKNILDNARNYAEDGRVSVFLSPERLAVRNKGCLPEGIDIFQRGVRGVASNGSGTTPSGSGLGLSLVQRACTILGWNVTYHQEEQATIFTVSFSAAHNAESRQQPNLQGI